MKIVMNEKARERERAEKMLRKEKRILEKCNLQQNLGQKENLPFINS